MTGAWGEALAAEYLRKRKYSLVDRGYSCRFGEIDLIVSNKNYLVFVEVKVRKNADFANAGDYVDYFKQKKLRTTASLYLSQNPTNLQPRFDVIEIYAPQGVATADPKINHIEGAFE